MKKEQLKEAVAHIAKGWEERSARRIYLSVDAKDILECSRIIFKQFGFRFATASASQTDSGFEILYHFSYDKAGEIYTVQVVQGKENPQIDSLSNLFPGASWMEREMWEMLGINFIGHPNLKRLLLAEDWPENEFPLRKAL
jgi:NADH:ubiquinone oxidoreductase subunit C